MRFLANNWKYLVILVSFLSAAVYEFWPREGSAEYALFIDAGSSGSRIHLYKWLPEDGDRVPIITELRLDKKCDETDKILSESGGSDDTDETARRVRDSLALLITCAKLELTDRIANFEKVRLYLMATAGMRIKRRMDEDDYDKIMEQVRAYLEDAPFDLKDASTIDAKEEALYAWVAANYLNGSLGKASKEPTIGILELGGASAQIAFVPEDPTKPNSKNTAVVPIPGGGHQIYARGYDGVGKEKFIEAFGGRNSCYPVDYKMNGGVLGVGNYCVCKDQINKLFIKPKKNSVFEQIKDADPPPRDKKYLAISNFHHTPKHFKQKRSLNLLELEYRGIEYCKSDWDDIIKQYNDIKPDFLSEYCFMAAYISVLLTTGGFRVEDRVEDCVEDRVEDRVMDDDGRVMLRLDPYGGKDKADVDWTLGALICSLYDGCPFGS